MVSVGATVGRNSLILEDSNFSLVRSVALIKPLGFLSKYLKYVADSPLLQNTIRENKRGAAQPCLYLSEISKFPFPLAPLAEQKEIVRLLEAAFARIDSIKLLHSELSIQHSSLTQSLLAKAFRGDLVPQDPNKKL